MESEPNSPSIRMLASRLDSATVAQLADQRGQRGLTDSAIGHDEDDNSSSSSYDNHGIIREKLNFGAPLSESHVQTQTLVVNAFHKVLSVLRQNQLDDGTEMLAAVLDERPKFIIPLLEELSFFLEQFHFSPSFLSQVLQTDLKSSASLRRKMEDELSDPDDSFLESKTNSYGPSCDHNTLIMIISEAQSLVQSLRFGLSETAWISAKSSINGRALDWIQLLYTIPSDLSASFIDDIPHTRHQLLRKSIGKHFPLYPSQGYKAFGSSTPVVLCTHHVPWINQLIEDVGLPQDCIRVGPDVIHSLKEGETLVAVMWVLPDPTEPITWSEAQTEQLINYVEQVGVWLHVEGSETILMTSLPDAKSNVIAQVADSIIVDASDLLQLERLHTPVIFYRTTPRKVKNSNEIVSEPISFNFDTVNIHLGIWFALQLKGKDFLHKLVNMANDLSEYVYQKLASIPHIRVLEGALGPHIKLHFRYELPKRVEVPVEVVSAQKTPSSIDTTIESSKETHSPQEDRNLYSVPEINEEKVTDYIFRYAQESLHIKFPIKLIRIPSDGMLYIEWDPMLCYNLNLWDKVHVDELLNFLQLQCVNITSCLENRPHFYNQVACNPSLKLINTNPIDYVGLGAVRYRPDFVAAIEEGTKKEAQGLSLILDELNASILNEVMQIHHVYYSAVGIDGTRCIGLHTDTTEMTPEKVEYYLKLIQETASRVEADTIILDKISALVKEGIREAEQAIKAANQQRATEKGVVRKLPILGRVWNWWSPYKGNKSDGKSYDLLSSTQTNNFASDGETQ